MGVLITNRQRRVAIDLRKLLKDASRLLELLNLRNTELSILIGNDATLKALNSRYRNKTATTDVLSFPLWSSRGKIPPNQEILLGDIVINAHMALRRAEETGMSLHQTLRQLLIHGLLHLAGYDHERSPSESRKMSHRERRLIHALAQMG